MDRIRNICFIFFALLLILFSSCKNQNSSQRKYKVGFSQCNSDQSWRLAMNLNVQSCAMQTGEIELYQTDAKLDSQKQIRDIDSLIALNVDILIVSPNETEPLTEVVSKAYQQGIPVILLDRRTSNDQYTCFIGADNYQIGYQAALALCRDLPDNSIILEIFGQKESSSSQQRTNGFHSGVEQKFAFKNFTFKQIYCDWTSACSYASLNEFLKKDKDFAAIFSHNDDMAFGAYNALKDNRVVCNNIVGIDGIYGPDRGIDLVIKGKLKNTFYYPDGGDVAIQTALDILKGKKTHKEIILPTVQIDTLNAKVLYDQMGMTDRQERKIIAQGEKISLQDNRMGMQKIIIYLCIIFLVIFLGAGVYIYILHHRSKLTNAELNDRNQEIYAQKEELLAQSAQLEDYNKALLREMDNREGSLRSAYTIQNALLPNDSYLKQAFNYFVIYQPKDIVSGDFYWFHREIEFDKEINIVAVVDCTGHGVPGAFMSLIGINFLNQIVRQSHIYSPAKILDNLNKLVRTSLKQETTGNDEGMEAIICRIDRYSNDTYDAIYEGAKFPVYHFKKDTQEMLCYKSTRKGIGGKLRNRENTLVFEDKVFDVQKGDRLFLTSDGIGDQNDITRKRYTSARLSKICFQTSVYPMKDQKTLVWQDLLDFKQNCSQRDDITVLGIELI